MADRAVSARLIWGHPGLINNGMVALAGVPLVPTVGKLVWRPLGRLGALIVVVQPPGSDHNCATAVLGLDVECKRLRDGRSRP